MAANIGSKRKLLGSALLGLALASLLFAFFFLATPEENKGSPDAPASDQAPVATPSLPQHSGSAGTEGTAGTDLAISSTPPKDLVAEDTSTQADSQLQEAELEHLSDVFQNSVYPSFQYDFQLNREGRAAIDVFVASMPEGLSSADLDTIATMIERQLSTPAAEDLAFIITHLYRLEQEEARLMSEGAPVTTMAGQLEAQEQLSQLRDQWFGPELSAQLFSDTDDGDQPSSTASSDPGTETSPPASDSTGAPPEGLTEEQAELADIESDWEQRYQKFLAEKQYIDRAGLDQTEKDRQIEALLRQHYTPHELEAARAFDQQRK